MKHGACFCSQGTGLSPVQELIAKTVTSLLTLLSLLYVALILFIRISIFKLLAGVVSESQILLIFCCGRKFFPLKILVDTMEYVIFCHFFTTGYSYPMIFTKRFFERMSHEDQD